MLNQVMEKLEDFRLMRDSYTITPQYVLGHVEFAVFEAVD